MSVICLLYVNVTVMDRSLKKKKFAATHPNTMLALFIGAKHGIVKSVRFIRIILTFRIISKSNYVYVS